MKREYKIKLNENVFLRRFAFGMNFHMYKIEKKMEMSKTVFCLSPSPFIH